MYREGLWKVSAHLGDSNISSYVSPLKLDNFSETSSIFRKAF